ncbi:hypothetical protein [Virgibacillus oceani]|uniref:Uncharacterized protein n=1 Tax=Virgibacillus oceani TaxID=1479511 RepID=A0A917GZ35_9BACI|nr:hypothetical protein [Virgibacillus oceani]GGG61226.1 hypothetical protein GCM10011398_00630 [Virgibacillus oceani]
MLSIKAVFNNQKSNYVLDDCDDIHLRWYENLTDNTFEFKYFDEKNNTFKVWTEHLIRFHDLILEYYSKGYLLCELKVNIYKNHDHTQDRTSFSRTHFCKNYSDSMYRIKEALENYCGTNENDLNFINYVLANSKLTNDAIMLLHFDLFDIMDESVIKFNKNEEEQLKEQTKSLLKLPYCQYGKNELKEKDIFDKTHYRLSKLLKDSNCLIIKKANKIINDFPFSFLNNN